MPDRLVRFTRVLTSRWPALLAGLMWGWTSIGGWVVDGAAAADVGVGSLVWSEPAKGLEVAELSVLDEGRVVETVHLARIDPAGYKFEVHVAPDAGRQIDGWMKLTGAILIVNGSYFDKSGKPATPVVSRGQPMGPTRYGTKHGAFIVEDGVPSVVDLRHKRWQLAFRDADEAMVSFPMLIGDDGRSRATNSNPLLLANRSFVGQDNLGRIVIGTTQSGYFSLDRFAEFLGFSGLELTRALNLDGGPPACQAIIAGAYRRQVCANGEDAADGGQLSVLSVLIGHRPWGLPIVLAVFPK